MRRIKQSSLDRLNLMMGVDDLLEGLKIEHPQLELGEADLRFPCPLHPAEPADPRSAHIHRATRYGACSQPRCAFHPGGSLLWLYSRALRQDIADVAEALAARKKLMLEYEFWMGDSTAPQNELFVYLEARTSAEEEPEVIPAAELAAFVKLHPEGARVNPLRFEVNHPQEVRERRDKQTLPLLGNFYVKLRAVGLPGARGADEGLDVALADARFLCRELTERYRIPEEGLALRFSAEGVQLEVDYRVLGAQPDPALPRVYGRMAFLLGGVDDQAPARPLPGGGSGHPARTPTLVQDAYGPGFSWLCEGARGAGGLCTIWISLDELMRKDGRALRDLARQARRPLDPPLRMSLERMARGLFLCAQEGEVRGRALPFSLLGEGLPPGKVAVQAAAAVSHAEAVATTARRGSTPDPAPFVPAPDLAGVLGPPASERFRSAERPAAASASANLFRSSGSVKEDSMSTPGPGPSAAKGADPSRRPLAAASPGAPAPPAGAAAPPGVAPPPASGGPGGRAGAAARTAAPAAATGSSLADQLARLMSRDHAPIPVTAFGSKTHAGDGLNQALQGGLQIGQVACIAGASGEGKSTFALQLADGVAFDNLQRERESQATVPVLYLCGQMRPEALLMKSLSRLAKLDSGDILRGKAQSKDLQEAMRIYQSFHRHMGVRQAAADPNLDTLRRTVEGLLSGGARAALVVIDPLAALAAADAAAEDSLRLLVRRLAALARDLPVAVLAVVSCRAAGRGGPLDYLEELAPLSEWLDVVFGLKTDLELERAGGVFTLDERVGWKKEWKAELKRKADGAPLKRGGIDYREVWKTEYSVLMTLKSRWQQPIHSAYYFHKTVHRFEEI